MFDSPATLLYRLQTVDQALTQRLNRLKEINTGLGKSKPVQLAQKQVDAAIEALKPWQGLGRDLDLEIKGIVAKMKATEDNLYSGRVTNPKAMQDLQNEIAALKRYQSKLEDELLEAMMNSEEGQARVDAAQKALSEAQALHAGSQVDLLAEKERLESELPRLEDQRTASAAGIEQSMLDAYEALRPKKAGSSIALLDNKSCTACQVEQTLNLVQKVQQDKGLVYCATCGRILAPRA